jgi:hypothetical protein
MEDQGIVSEPEQVKVPVAPRPVLKPKRKPSRGARMTDHLIAASAQQSGPETANTEFSDGVSRNGTVRGFPAAGRKGSLSNE